MRLRPIPGLVPAAILIAGCVSPFVETWKSPDWSGRPFRNVLVVGNAQSEVARRAYEDAMCTRLAEIGVRGEPSYRLLPGETLDREAIARAVAAGRHDGLITARLVGVDQRARYEPAPVAGPYVGWRTWGGFYGTGTVRIDQVARIETQAWSVAGEGAMVWAGTSEKVVPRDIPRYASSLAVGTVDTLQKAGVLPGA